MISSPAVFGPTPATPGILSELSPCKAFSSIISAGVRPYSSMSFASSYLVVCVCPIFVVVSSTFTLLLMSCRESRSPVAIKHTSWGAVCAESVPRISSASYPSHSTIWHPNARSRSFMGSICSWSSDGIALRPALYPSYILCRNVGAFRSNATATA